MDRSVNFERESLCSTEMQRRHTLPAQNNFGKSCLLGHESGKKMSWSS
jgi:hypothetical protein